MTPTALPDTQNQRIMINEIIESSEHFLFKARHAGLDPR